jgi:hypothetical protein
MKSKVVNKSLKYLAVSLFIFAMVANIKVTLTDPFMFTSEMVLAEDTSQPPNDDCVWSEEKGDWVCPDESGDYEYFVMFYDIDCSMCVSANYGSCNPSDQTC